MQNSQNASDSSKFVGPQDDQEISLLDIVIFLKGAWKMIAMMGVAGLMAASVYLLVTPPQYEAVATITMARVPAPNNVLGVNIEEPPALIARMGLAGSLNSEVVTACGFEGSSDPAPLLAKSIKFAIPKGLSSIVELKVIRPTPELAKACAQKVVEIIAQSQAQMLGSLADYLQAANKARLATIAERMSQDKAILAKAEQPHGPVTPTYFAVLSEIRALEDEEVRINAALTVSQVQVAQLQAPIEVSDHPVYPKKAISLAAGVFGGLFFGLLIALARQMIVKLKSQTGSAL